MTDPTPREDEPALRTVQVQVCEACIAREGAECHTPGCLFWMTSVADLPVTLAAHARTPTGETGAGERERLVEAFRQARVLLGTAPDGVSDHWTTPRPDEAERMADVALRALATPPPQITRQAVIEAVRQEASRDEIALAGVRARLLAMLIADRLGLTEENHDG